MSETLTKAKMTHRVHQKLGGTKREARELVDELFAIVQDGLVDGERIKIPAFGSLSVETREPRWGTNPRTGEPLLIPRRRKVKFEYSKKLKEVLNS